MEVRVRGAGTIRRDEDLESKTCGDVPRAVRGVAVRRGGAA